MWKMNENDAFMDEGPVEVVMFYILIGLPKGSNTMGFYIYVCVKRYVYIYIYTIGFLVDILSTSVGIV